MSLLFSALWNWEGTKCISQSSPFGSSGKTMSEAAQLNFPGTFWSDKCKRALRLRESPGRSQAFADSAKYDYLFQIPFHSRSAPCRTLLFRCFFPLFGCGGVCVGQHVCVIDSLFLFLLFVCLLVWFFVHLFIWSTPPHPPPQWKEKEGLKSPRSWVPSAPLKTLGIVEMLRIWLECHRNALLLGMDRPMHCRFYQDSPGHCTYSYTGAVVWARAG